MEKVLSFIDTYKYQILVVLVLILLWRILAQNIILVLVIVALVYFIWKENKSTSNASVVLVENK